MSVVIAMYVHDLAVAAKAASASLATASDEQRQEAVRAMAAALRNGVDSIVAANELDMSAARDAGTSAGLLDRLLLTPERVEGMAAGLEKLAELPDPVGRVLDHRVLASGVDLTRVSVPLGLVAMVYEARPNVTADAAGINVTKYKYLGLMVFVAIPLPGTGAWTGALVAALLGRRLSHAMLSIGAGVMTACCIVALLCKGIIHIAGL